MLEWTPDDLTEEGLWERWLESEAVRAFESGRIGPDQFAKQTINEFELTVSEEQFLDAFVTWVDGLFEGHGKHQFKDGRVNEGQFKGGKFCG